MPPLDQARLHRVAVGVREVFQRLIVSGCDRVAGAPAGPHRIEAAKPGVESSSVVAVDGVLEVRAVAESVRGADVVVITHLNAGVKEDSVLQDRASDGVAVEVLGLLRRVPLSGVPEGVEEEAPIMASPRHEDTCAGNDGSCAHALVPSTLSAGAVRLSAFSAGLFGGLRHSRVPVDHGGPSLQRNRCGVRKYGREGQGLGNGNSRRRVRSRATGRLSGLRAKRNRTF